MGQLILKLLVGGGAGLLAWALTEPQYGTSDAAELRMVLFAGALIGFAIGGLSGLVEGTRKRALRGAGLGAVFGSIGISLGYSVGTGIEQMIFQVPPHMVQGPQQVIARAIALTPVGLFLGAAVGASTLNLKRTIQGATGGLIAGLATGFGFDIVGGLLATPALIMQGQTKGDVGQIPRALTWTMLGATIGLFIGIVERVSRQAWVRMTLGRNEGKEWAIYGANTLIGRSEAAQIPLFSDPSVAPMHAVIQYHQGNYFLTDCGSGAGTFLNGQPIQQAQLTPGAEIRVGNTVLHFMLKSMKQAYQPGAYAPMPGQFVNQPYPQPSPQPYPQPNVGPGAVGMGQPTQVMTPTMAYPPAGSPSPTVAYQNPGVTLVALDGPLLGQRYPMSGPIEVGRDMPAIPMSFDSAASRRHASLAPIPGGVQVADLGSTNGVFVNGQKTPSGIAPVGATIKIGSTTFRVEA